MKFYDREGNPHYVEFDQYRGRYAEINTFALHNIDVSLRRIAKSLESIVRMESGKNEISEKTVEPHLIRSGECPFDDIPIVDGGRFARCEKIIENESCS